MKWLMVNIVLPFNSLFCFPLDVVSTADLLRAVVINIRRTATQRHSIALQWQCILFCAVHSQILVPNVPYCMSWNADAFLSVVKRSKRRSIEIPQQGMDGTDSILHAYCGAADWSD